MVVLEQPFGSGGKSFREPSHSELVAVVAARENYGWSLRKERARGVLILVPLIVGLGQP